MNKKKLLARIGAVAAAVSLPGLAMAEVGTDTTTTKSASATVRLEATLTGTIRLAIFERFSGEAPGALNRLDQNSGAVEGASDTVDFGSVTVNPTNGALTAGDGYAVNTTGGAAFVARLQTELFYTGGNVATISLAQGTNSVAPVDSMRGATADFEWWYACAQGTGNFDSAAAENDWTLTNGAFAGTMAANGGVVLTPSAAECLKYSTNDPADAGPGATNDGEVDLVLFLADAAAQGDYGMDYVFSVGISN